MSVAHYHGRKFRRGIHTQGSAAAGRFNFVRLWQHLLRSEHFPRSGVRQEGAASANCPLKIRNVKGETDAGQDSHYRIPAISGRFQVSGEPAKLF